MRLLLEPLERNLKDDSVKRDRNDVAAESSSPPFFSSNSLCLLFTPIIGALQGLLL